ncbi:Cytochrome c2 [Roseibaca ekhonensis]|jgi:cytochrome c|uniref:Cytochrome c2 n=1 Tax=Roseinatronobacter ekhonensis TaxID=254356 RepID=A0A3B0MQT3_9RHOB|nr:c-type cytochrome [Roseibaca ekhonensis]SUZ30316.1 Cytochrome c2 [Roseibaca ekhonensis]
MKGLFLSVSLSVGAVLAPSASLGQAVAIGDAEAGAEVYRRECASCHQVGEGATHRIGPHLNHIFDRGAASHEDFRYSGALERQGRDGLTWDLRRLHAYIENPRALVSGTRMSYRGLKDEERRSDLVAYLRVFSDQPQNIPEAAPTAIRPEVDLSPEILAIVGDVEYGEYLSQECSTCHQRSGANEGIPGIVGWPEEDFVVAMHAYKEKLRPHAVMQSVSARLGEEEIASLAAYFAALDE